MEIEIPKYKKRSAKRPPTKSKHRHVYEPCVFEYVNPEGKFDLNLGFVPITEHKFGKYCTKCGKISSPDDELSAKIYIFSRGKYGFYHEYSEWAKAQFSSETRELRCFFIRDPFDQKFVELGTG